MSFFHTILSDKDLSQRTHFRIVAHATIKCAVSGPTLERMTSTLSSAYDDGATVFTYVPSNREDYIDHALPYTVERFTTPRRRTYTLLFGGNRSVQHIQETEESAGTTQDETRYYVRDPKGGYRVTTVDHIEQTIQDGHAKRLEDAFRHYGSLSPDDIAKVALVAQMYAESMKLPKESDLLAMELCSSGGVQSAYGAIDIRSETVSGRAVNALTVAPFVGGALEVAFDSTDWSRLRMKTLHFDAYPEVIRQKEVYEYAEADDPSVVQSYPQRIAVTKYEEESGALLCTITIRIEKAEPLADESDVYVDPKQLYPGYKVK